MTVGQIASKAWRGVRMLKGIVNSEKQYFDHTFSAQSVNTAAPQIVCLNQIGQGDDVTNRKGNSILAKSIQGRLDWSLGGTSSFCRAIIVCDMENIGSTPAYTDVIDNTVSPLVAPLNKDTASRWQVLADKVFTLDNVGQSVKMVNIYRKLHVHIKFTGTATTDFYKNSLFLLLFSSSSSMNSDTVTGHFRLRYYDN